ncbi:solute carrier organic anion transporter family member 4A1 isoform X2 [Patella vulgata]|uniref:solute carrier organic anion transporter family member 4A1 isoform X2 n=1 Tax=Patella vulgata TaxID=6465 RepID=UPI00217FCB03|nr:solute carrier organic anion transporter family member 4A1 isoform X2 [Patella vulgata]XP_050408149.1 solute carrier organic anion transporter family member 4A1 isoform X2 [Patella vulgata]XP_050408158.1 solute carrier organic anion transporter family member 4A1 isoform X2 [Patella vulgata]
MTILKSRPAEYTAMTQAIIQPTNKSSSTEERRYKIKKDLGSQEETCGWFFLQPLLCQTFRKPAWVLFFLCCAGGIQGMVVNGFVNVVISNIERRFSISSTESGTIASCYDIASVLLLIPITYFGGQGIKPRYLGIGVLVLGIGSFVFSLPHFTTDPYHVDGTTENVCRVLDNVTNSCETGESFSSLSNYKYVFFLGQLLHGAGAAPLYTLGVTYLDENLPQRSSSFYVGIFYSFAILGPALGYLVGGQFLNIYTDIGSTDLNTLTIDSDNPRWVGAWWIGFLISGTMALCTAIPLSGFPRSLPGSSIYRAERGKEAYHKEGADDSEKVGLKRGFRDILLSIKLLVSNPTFMFLNFAAASEGILLSGFSTFAPKFIEAQFSFSSGWSAQLMGLALIPAGGGGTLLGGFLVKKFNWRVSTIIKFCLLSTCISIPFGFVFFMYCDNIPFAGINIKYDKDVSSANLEFLGDDQLNNTCNALCKCTQDEYTPICGRDGKMYFSPCYAGCSTRVNNSEPKQYTNCDCVNFTVTNETSYMTELGKCESSCPWLPLFMPMFTMVIFLTFITSMPALSATLRCVPEHQRTFSLGIQWIIARCLGSIPGPILFGTIIDLTCILWQKKCSDKGACLIYDNKQLSYNLLALGTVLKILSVIFFLSALMLYKKPPDRETAISTDTMTTSMTSSVNSKIANGDLDTEEKKKSTEQES